MNMTHTSAHSKQRTQQGFALVVSMILLVVITLLALGALRSTTLQTRMAANLYDRGLAFQSAESALLAAQTVVSGNPDLTSIGGTSCTPTDNACPLVPSNTWTTDATGWRSIDSSFLPNSSQYSAIAQYHVDYMGVKEVEDDDEFDTGLKSGYDAQHAGGVTTMNVYRVTVRSNPNGGDGRSSVVLQSTVEVPK